MSTTCAVWIKASISSAADPPWPDSQPAGGSPCALPMSWRLAPHRDRRVAVGGCGCGAVRRRVDVRVGSAAGQGQQRAEGATPGRQAVTDSTPGECGGTVSYTHLTLPTKRIV